MKRKPRRTNKTRLQQTQIDINIEGHEYRASNKIKDKPKQTEKETNEERSSGSQKKDRKKDRKKENTK